MFKFKRDRWIRELFNTMQKPIFQFSIEPTTYKSFRDQIISQMTEEINTLRIGTKYKPVTKRMIAIRANSNPFLKSDGELELVYKTCSKKGNFSHFFYITK